MSADTLASQLLADGPSRARLLDDCVRLLDDEVARKRGLSGVAVKGAYKVISKIRPGFVRGVLEALLPEWIAELEGEYSAWRAADSGPFSARLLAHKPTIAELLLRVTDRRAAKTSHKTAKRAYDKLRSGAKTQVIEGLPAAAAVLDRHLEA